MRHASLRHASLRHASLRHGSLPCAGPLRANRRRAKPAWAGPDRPRARLAAKGRALAQQLAGRRVGPRRARATRHRARVANARARRGGSGGRRPRGRAAPGAGGETCDAAGAQMWSRCAIC
ncbi:MAG: hypothetical protein ACREU3_04040 [Steroidobacteraceae bacterium]